MVHYLLRAQLIIVRISARASRLGESHKFLILYTSAPHSADGMTAHVRARRRLDFTQHTVINVRLNGGFPLHAL
jgi:hypothetical protein